MIGELQEANWELPKSLFTLPSHCSDSKAMEPRMRKLGPSTLGMTSRGGNAPRDEGLRRERQYHHRPFPQGSAKKSAIGSCFGLESLLLLVCLTASLLILPLILPPLPPPPFLLLLLPICIFGLLMVLAFMPSNIRDLTYM